MSNDYYLEHQWTVWYNDILNENFIDKLLEWLHCVKSVQSKYGVFSDTYFPHLVWIWRDAPSIFCSNVGKWGPENIPYLGTFHVELISPFRLIQYTAPLIILQLCHVLWMLFSKALVKKYINHQMLNQCILMISFIDRAKKKLLRRVFERLW